MYEYGSGEGGGRSLGDGMLKENGGEGYKE